MHKNETLNPLSSGSGQYFTAVGVTVIVWPFSVIRNSQIQLDAAGVCLCLPGQWVCWRPWTGHRPWVEEVGLKAPQVPSWRKSGGAKPLPGGEALICTRVPNREQAGGRREACGV